jgi:hypothetical protein
LSTPGRKNVALFQYGRNARKPTQSRDRQERQRPARGESRNRAIGRARLPGWRFELDLFSSDNKSLVTDIVEANDNNVWGGLYELDLELIRRSDRGRSVLDRIEGRGTESGRDNYDLRGVEVELSGTLVAAYTYVGLEEARRRCRQDHRDAKVTCAYASYVLEGARDFRLPDVYIRMLEATLKRHTD